ncbi:hypothetical protein BRADI_3g22044v3 [Brachypodium distachyon]|uniref:Transposase (putative) gypsy type domain-containing protein n=1 Tax=Brachypodium distachyon TaxID=15368 RepID=A0A2K2CYR8_BRADI|nr:hypothetical protein BRADI_3g22044v3 [Brachypodium distachyon]
MGRKKISTTAGASAAADGKKASRNAPPALDKKSKKTADTAPGGDKRTGEWKRSGILVRHFSVMRRHRLIPGEDTGKVRVPDNEVHDLTPNSYLHIACFITLRECYLGVKPHWGLWKKLFIIKRQGKAQVRKLKSWNHELTTEEDAEATVLLRQVVELQQTPEKERRIQPIQARVHSMWEYSGPSDSTRVYAQELSDEDLLTRVRVVTRKEITLEDLESPLPPYGPD